MSTTDLLCSEQSTAAHCGLIGWLAHPYYIIGACRAESTACSALSKDWGAIGHLDHDTLSSLPTAESLLLQLRQLYDGCQQQGSDYILTATDATRCQTWARTITGPPTQNGRTT